MCRFAAIEAVKKEAIRTGNIFYGWHVLTSFVALFRSPTYGAIQNGGLPYGFCGSGFRKG
ncbi:MAG: hypothetical protein ACXWFC_12390, partial [Nitrososphaeraceae archaeon]